MSEEDEKIYDKYIAEFQKYEEWNKATVSEIKLDVEL